jgi:hypothetical protein
LVRYFFTHYTEKDRNSDNRRFDGEENVNIRGIPSPRYDGISMPTFLERYGDGDCVAVWDDLVALGEGVRHELYYADAVAVATETMRRARHNVELLIQRLADVGYRFIPPADEYVPDLNEGLNQLSKRIWTAQGSDMRPYLEAAAKRVKESLGPLAAKLAERKSAQAARVAETSKKPPLKNPAVFDPPGKQTAAWLKRLEKAAGGPLPISLRAWYEQVGGVSLMGSHDVLNPKDSQTAADPLVVSSLGDLLEMVDDEGGDGEIGLWIAPDDLHKANVSGGDPYTITIPNACADAEFEYEWHATTFVNYLRKAFEWGGFPGWERDKTPPLEAIAKLTEGLLPL